jgi:hypothetical protein
MGPLIAPERLKRRADKCDERKAATKLVKMFGVIKKGGRIEDLVSTQVIEYPIPWFFLAFTS